MEKLRQPDSSTFGIIRLMTIDLNEYSTNIFSTDCLCLLFLKDDVEYDIEEMLRMSKD